MATVGKQIEVLRCRMTMNQTEFGELFGRTAMSISRWERGTNQPSSRELIRLGVLAKQQRIDGWNFWRLAGITQADVRAALGA